VKGRIFLLSANDRLASASAKARPFNGGLSEVHRHSLRPARALAQVASLKFHHVNRAPKTQCDEIAGFCARGRTSMRGLSLF
jgi:hypothetical protein